jgi:stage II sporulation protein D
LSGRELRQTLGGRAIRSALFDVRATADRVRFLGSGSGHGVGLSQWGARELALRGRSYREILTHYYPGTTPETLAATEPVGSSRLSALP